MSFLGFGKKKKKSAEKPPVGKPSSAEDIPPPKGKPEGRTSAPAPQVRPEKQGGIPEPRHVDDLEIPAPSMKSSKSDTMELPTLEFPTMPSEKQEEHPEFKKEAVGGGKEEKTPNEVPNLKIPKKEPKPEVKEPEKKAEMQSPEEKAEPKIPDIPKLEIPEKGKAKEEPEKKKAETKRPEKQEQEKEEKAEESKPGEPEKPLKSKVKTILESRIEPEMEYEEVPGPTVVKEEEGPMFIDMQNFERLLKSINESQDRARNAAEKLLKINGIKNSEDSQIDAFQSSLENAQRKLVFMDKMIFEKKEG